MLQVGCQRANSSRFLVLCLRLAPALAAENLFLRQQLAFVEGHDRLPRMSRFPFDYHLEQRRFS